MSSTLDKSTGLIDGALALVHQRDGRLTQQLLREPGNFGLGQVPARLKPDAVTTVACGYCSTGCGLNVHLKDGEAVNLTPATDYPVNLGMACPKGWEALAVLSSNDRATTPLLGNGSGGFQPVGWDRALRTMCERFKRIQSLHGNDSVAFLSTGQMPTEEMFYLGCLAKFGMGMLHGDGNTRQCMATAVVAYKESFGFDAPPFTYQDFEESDVLVFVGSNLCVGHPIMWERVCRNPHAPEIIVVDPRQTETAQAATRHLQIAPKSDLALFYGLAHILIREGWIDRPFIDAHTHGFEKFADHVADFTPQAVAEWTGIDAERLFDVARVIHEGRRVSFWWTMGVNQSYEGVRTAQSLINLALMTGNIGRPGTGANSITGQANAMGSRLFSNTTNLVGGHDFRSAADRQKVAEVLSIDVGRIPTENSWAYDAIIDGIRTHKIRGLWVVCTNPAHSWIHQNQLQGLLKSLDFLVVQDMYHTTETAQHADLVLPAAGWGEKEGTFINSERRFGLLKKVARAPGEALADFEIFKLVAKYWGCGEMFADWHEPEDVFQAMKAVSAGQPCDITGIEDYVAIDRAGGIQWPCRDAAEAEDQQRRLFADGEFYHDDRRARFLFEKPATMPEPPDDLFPLLLLTGRGSVSQWHTQTRTSKSAILRKLYPQQIYVEVHPQDAERFGLADGGLARVESRRGDLTAQVFVTPTVAVGQIFIPMHYRETNRLTLPHFDPYSRQPSYKDCAVRIQPVNRLETARNGDS